MISSEQEALTKNQNDMNITLNFKVLKSKTTLENCPSFTLLAGFFLLINLTKKSVDFQRMMQVLTFVNCLLYFQALQWHKLILIWTISKLILDLTCIMLLLKFCSTLVQIKLMSPELTLKKLYNCEHNFLSVKELKVDEKSNSCICVLKIRSDHHQRKTGALYTGRRKESFTSVNPFFT